MASDFKGFGDPRKDVHWHGERVLFHSDLSQCLQIPELNRLTIVFQRISVESEVASTFPSFRFPELSQPI
jgi:hypothetical protein